MMVIDAWKKAADDPLGVAPARRRLVRQPLSKVLRKMMTFHIAADASGARETSLEVRQRLIVDLREIAYADPVRRELPDRAPSALRRPSRCVLGRDPSVGRATLSEYGLRRLICLLKRIWRAHGLQPHRVRQFKLSNDPQ
jgi:hypothetical protein